MIKSLYLSSTSWEALDLLSVVLLGCLELWKDRAAVGWVRSQQVKPTLSADISVLFPLCILILYATASPEDSFTCRHHWKPTTKGVCLKERDREKRWITTQAAMQTLGWQYKYFLWGKVLSAIAKSVFAKHLKIVGSLEWNAAIFHEPHYLWCHSCL